MQFATWVQRFQLKLMQRLKEMMETKENIHIADLPRNIFQAKANLQCSDRGWRKRGPQALTSRESGRRLETSRGLFEWSRHVASGMRDKLKRDADSPSSTYELRFADMLR